MAEDKSGKKDKIKSRKNYRIFLRNNETLQEVFSLKLNFKAMYLLVSTILVMFFFITWLLIAYTPLKRLMPGYDDVYIHPEYVKLNNKVNEIEAAFEEQEFYIESFRNILTGENADSLLEDQLEELTASMDNDWSPADEEVGNTIDLSKSSSPPAAEKDAEFIPIKSDQVNLPVSNIADKLYLIPPVNGVIIERFDPVKRHYGIDISAPKNSPVKAIMDGHVISSDWTLETGNSLAILHDNNVLSFYKHNAINLVKAGSYVRAGEAVAIIGNTGTQSTGPHLHFELWKNGKPVDPTDYINF